MSTFNRQSQSILPQHSEQLTSLLALTAQASVTPHVQRSIAELLHLGQDYRTIKASFNRPNIQ
jgi:superfamily II DNA helicase RecQ